MPNARDSIGSTDAAGCCPTHPLVQLRCRSQRTGAWWSKLDFCPLCAADDQKVGAGAGSGARFAPAPTATKSPAVGRRERSIARGWSDSRVCFPAVRQMVRRRSVSALPAPTAAPMAVPKALKEPKYKECKVEMQRQLDESEEKGVTFMSEDIDLGSMNMTEFWHSMGFEESEVEDDGGSVLSFSGDQDDNDGNSTGSGQDEDGEQKEEKTARMLSADHEEEQKRSHYELTRKLEKKLRDSRPPPQDSKAGRSGGSRPPGRMARGLRREPRQGSSSHSDAPQGSRSRDSSRDVGQSLGRANGEASSRSRGRQPKGSAPFLGHGLGSIGAALAPSNGEASGRSRSRQSPGSAPFLGHGLGPSGAAPAPSQCRPRQVDVPDEVFFLSCTGNSAAANSVATVGPSNHRNVSGYLYDQEDLEENPREEDDEDGDDKNKEDEETHPAATVINTANYDSKGRCVHHPRVRLRNKKMFGKGWKILLSACPDCCIDELRRIHTVNEKERKVTKKTLERLSKNQEGWLRQSDGDGDGEVGVDVAPGSRDKKMRKMTRKTLERLTKNQEGADRLHRTEGGGDRDGHAGLPTSGSVGNSPAGVVDGVGEPRRRSPRFTSALPRPAHPRRAPSQEGSRAAPRPPRTAVPGSQNQRSMSEDSSNLAPDLWRSPPQDSFHNESIGGGTGSKARWPPPPPRKAQRTICVDHSVGDPGRRSPRSASVPPQPVHPVHPRRAPSQEGSRAVSAHKEYVRASLHKNQPPPAAPLIRTKKKRRSKSRGGGSKSYKNGDLPQPPHHAPGQEPPQLDTVRMRKMLCSDAEGSSGTLVTTETNVDHHHHHYHHHHHHLKIRWRRSWRSSLLRRSL